MFLTSSYVGRLRLKTRSESDLSTAQTTSQHIFTYKCYFFCHGINNSPTWGYIYFAFCFRSCKVSVRTPPLGTKGGWREGPDPPRVAAHCRMVYQVVYKHNNYNNYNMVPVSCKQAGLRIACFSRNILDFSCFLGDKKTRMDKKCKEAPGGVGGPPV